MSRSKKGNERTVAGETHISRVKDPIRRLQDVKGLTQEEVDSLQEVSASFEFRASTYYLNLIDWTDPDDPLRRIIMPTVAELNGGLELDPSDEAGVTLVHGLQHKYRPTALLLLNDTCASYCRFCFRKRFTLATSRDGHILPERDIGRYEKETTFDITEGLSYIAAHPEIDNILLTGGDPLMLSQSRLESVLSSLRNIPHVRIIRIGTKVPAFDPERVTDSYLDMLARYGGSDRSLYLMLHFNHPRELTRTAKQRLEAMLERGLVLNNQTPLLKDINDDPDVIADMFDELAACGVAPYYLFHCRPVQGNMPYMTTVQEGLRIASEARRRLNGLAGRFRYVASHATGKIEIVGQLGGEIILRYHEAKYIEDHDRIFTWAADRPCYWFDEAVSKYKGL